MAITSATSEKRLNDAIDSIEYAYNSSNIKSTIVGVLLDFANSLIILPASSIGGLTTNDLIIKYYNKTKNLDIDTLRDMMESGEFFDSVPTQFSKKAVSSYGILAAFGDLNATLKLYDTLIKPDV